MSKKELKQLMKDEILIDEDPEMDCWAVRFLIAEKDQRFLSTLVNQMEDLNERIKDKLYSDQQLLARYAEIHEKYSRLSDRVDHPYEDLSTHYPFLYKAPKNPNLEPFQPRKREQLL